MHIAFKTIVSIFLLLALPSQAQLAVKVLPPKVSGQKIMVPLVMTNSFVEKIESARAAVFIADEEGRVVGQAAKWVIGGGRDKPGLASDATNGFTFVITGVKPFTTTNLTAKLSFSRVVLEGGKVADPVKQVQITYSSN